MDWLIDSLIDWLDTYIDKRIGWLIDCCLCHNHLLNSPVPDSNSVTRVEQVLHDPAAHDAQAQEAEVQLARLNVLQIFADLFSVSEFFCSWDFHMPINISQTFSLRIWLLVTRSMSRPGLAGRAREEGLSSKLATAALDFFMVGVCIGLSDRPSPSLQNNEI